MIFDTLFAIDSKFKPHPQMVDGYEASPDKLNYSFVLRDGLKFHDGQPVRGADCVASIKRWMARDALGQTLATVVADMKGGDGKNFSIHLKEPFPLLIDGLAKVSSLAPFIMPERLAKTDPYKQITEMIGSGPFKFVKEEHQPGNLVVYVKTPTMCHGASRRTGPRAAKWSRSTVSNGMSCPTSRPKPRRSSKAKTTGTRTRRPIFGRSWPATRKSFSRRWTRSAAPGVCASISSFRRSTTSRCVRRC
jgi:ABC-type transport system substrate-binding protein